MKFLRGLCLVIGKLLIILGKLLIFTITVTFAILKFTTSIFLMIMRIGAFASYTSRY